MDYHFLLWLNNRGNKCRAAFGLPYWSLATYIKDRVKSTRETTRIYEDLAAAEAKKQGYDGVICGHIHQSQIRSIYGVLYCNDGDRTEICTAMVEDKHG